MADKKNPQTPKFRVSFPFVFKPSKYDENSPEVFSVVALFPKGTDLSVMEKAAKEAMEKKWGTDQSKWPKGRRSPFRKVEELEEQYRAGFPPDAVWIRLSSKERPGIVDTQNNPITDPVEFYAGCFARASFAAYAYDTKGNKGVAFGLRNLQKLADGESLTGRAKPEDEFAPVEDTGSAADGVSAESLFS